MLTLNLRKDHSGVYSCESWFVYDTNTLNIVETQGNAGMCRHVVEHLNDYYDNLNEPHVYAAIRRNHCTVKEI